jgi:hypothetical protein
MCRRNLGVTLLHFHARDDQLALFRPQPLQRLLVPFDGLAPDGLVERRRGPIGVLGIVIDAGRGRIPRDAANLVAHTIDQSLPKIGLERAFVARLEIIDMPEGLRQRFLDQILGIP